MSLVIPVHWCITIIFTGHSLPAKHGSLPRFSQAILSWSSNKVSTGEKVLIICHVRFHLVVYFVSKVQDFSLTCKSKIGISINPISCVNWVNNRCPIPQFDSSDNSNHKTRISNCQGQIRSPLNLFINLDYFPLSLHLLSYYLSFFPLILINSYKVHLWDLWNRLLEFPTLNAWCGWLWNKFSLTMVKAGESYL